MKKKISILLTICCLFVMTACGGEKAASYNGKTIDVKLDGLVTVKVPEELKPTIENRLDGNPYNVTINKGKARMEIGVAETVHYTKEGTWESVKKLDKEVGGKGVKDYKHSLGDAYKVEAKFGDRIHIHLDDKTYVSIYMTGEGFKDLLKDPLVKYTVDSISK